MFKSTISFIRNSDDIIRNCVSNTKDCTADDVCKDYLEYLYGAYTIIHESMHHTKDTNNTVVEKLKKIKALSEYGLDGEKENARILLNKMMTKYNINSEAVDNFNDEESDQINQVIHDFLPDEIDISLYSYRQKKLIVSSAIAGMVKACEKYTDESGSILSIIDSGDGWYAGRFFASDDYTSIYLVDEPEESDVSKDSNNAYWICADELYSALNSIKNIDNEAGVVCTTEQATDSGTSSTWLWVLLVVGIVIWIML